MRLGSRLLLDITLLSRAVPEVPQASSRTWLFVIFSWIMSTYLSMFRNAFTRGMLLSVICPRWESFLCPRAKVSSCRWRMTKWKCRSKSPTSPGRTSEARPSTTWRPPSIARQRLLVMVWSSKMWASPPPALQVVCPIVFAQTLSIRTPPRKSDAAVGRREIFHRSWVWTIV